MFLVVFVSKSTKDQDGVEFHCNFGILLKKGTGFKRKNRFWAIKRIKISYF